jgi:hypothetical protein
VHPRELRKRHKRTGDTPHKHEIHAAATSGRPAASRHADGAITGLNGHRSSNARRLT